MSFRLLAAALLLATAAIGGCESADNPSDCLAAFRNAEPRAGPPYQATSLDDAIRACDSIDEWRTAWVQVPEAHQPEDDPIAFLRERCALVGLAQTGLCQEVASGRS